MILRSFSSATLRENEDSYMALFLSHSRDAACESEDMQLLMFLY